jgi:atypical protein kinase C zeta type
LTASGRIGDAAVGNSPPWARLFPDPLTGRGHFGVYGPTTEQFAIGSLLYCMTRGHEPYGHPDDDPDLDTIRLFKNEIFPPLQADDDALDGIINRCWTGSYGSIKDLAEATAQLPGATDIGDAVTSALM